MGTFEFNGEKYKQASKHQKEWGNKMISDLELKGNEIILDLGCGDGFLTEQLAALVPNGKVTGIDASIGMLETAKKFKKSNLDFICMDINAIDFTNRFDIIYSNAALHWIKDHKLLLKNCLSALKENGIIKWSFAGDGTCSNFYEVSKIVMNDSAFKEYFCTFEWPWFMPSKSEYETILESAGFNKIHLEYENADRYFSSVDEMVKWIDQPSIVPFIKNVPETEKGKFRDMVVNMMIEKTKQADGRCFETFRRINVLATK